MTGSLSVFSSLSDEELLARVEALAVNERSATVQLIASLAEFDVRRLYLGEGFGSLYDYCTRRLGLSEYGAYRRIEAARVSRRFPAVLDALAAGEITLTTVNLLARDLTESNYRQLLAEARYASKREVELIVARLHPTAPMRASVRRLAVLRPVLVEPHSSSAHMLWPASGEPEEGIKSNSGVTPNANDLRGASPSELAEATSRLSSLDPTPEGAAHSEEANALSESSAASGTKPAASTAGRPNPPGDDAWLSSRGVTSQGHVAAGLEGAARGECYRLHVTLSREGHDRLRRLRDLLRHAVPDGNLDVIVDRAITHLLVQTEKRRLARASRPQQTKRQVRAGSRRIPAHVQRAVWERDGARCAFVGRHGRCTARAFLEMHHVVPFAAGGKPTVDNIQLHCRAHNSYEAEKYFGKKHAKAASRR